jgi:thioredoxin-dependent peroxiredoxin
MLNVGEAAPGFELPDAAMEMVNLAQFKGKKNVVLFFYPKDGTPACTMEAIEFSDIEDEFERYDTVVFGVSRDDFISHAAFRDKHGLTAQLLADIDGEVCAMYGVWQEKEVDGVKKEGILRTTFVIDKQGFIRHAMPVANPRGHALEVLKRVKEMAGPEDMR